MLAAFAATGLYYVAFAIFKVAADRMEPMRGHRILHMTWVILSSWIFLGGLVLLLGGLVLQILALSELAISVAVPIFVSGLVPLLLIALTVFGERLRAREWASLGLIAAAMLLLALSIGNPAPINAAEVEPWKLAVAVIPPLTVPLMLMIFGDYRPDGRHARPVTGIAYGMSAGFPIGTAELAIKGWGDTIADLQFLRTPYPYLAVVAAALGLGIIMVGYQRCRVSIVTTVMTISAKTYLLVVGTVLYGEPWPDAGQAVLRILALALAIYALLLFPRHDDRQRPAAAAEPAASQRNADRAGAAQPPRPRAVEDTWPDAPAVAPVPQARSARPQGDGTGKSRDAAGEGPRAERSAGAEPDREPGRTRPPEPEWRRGAGRARPAGSFDQAAPPGGRTRVPGAGVRTPDVRPPHAVEVPLAAPVNSPQAPAVESTGPLPLIGDEQVQAYAAGVKWSPIAGSPAQAPTSQNEPSAGRSATGEMPAVVPEQSRRADAMPNGQSPTRENPIVNPGPAAGGPGEAPAVNSHRNGQTNTRNSERSHTGEIPVVGAQPSRIPEGRPGAGRFHTGEMPVVRNEPPQEEHKRPRPSARIGARSRALDEEQPYRPKYRRPE
ncbi:MULTISPECIES: hypothetical protein [Thermomonospora]|uniref:EamA domain-containing protein n=1 Tax=Thermomonospora curvata (strain ATCC 19995 / DSM 43183 / JCM 3096 / KCTC 9072 / NBRC 15933 / NCIMB 10081 / Henssen B9) TaxID=471852 RepID=D1AAU2_THECD|nr:MULTISPECIES: hypothetical protein [Thermomonospora]ACY97102.1 hypothetical protein Tcur_1526 [Thermomonospora curvata DSM 43183]PKK14972.1 MAG: hypothetical protein BUE48_007415 [Thermomonospora sp. CIF 1]